jgi:hypothetical protein
MCNRRVNKGQVRRRPARRRLSVTPAKGKGVMRVSRVLTAGLLASVLMSPAGGAGGAAAGPTEPGVSKAAAERTGTLRFRVDRGGSPIGTHEVTFRQAGDRLTVRVDIELEVGIGPIAFFRYEHANTTTWRDGRVVRIETLTNDNGDKHRVEAERTPAGDLRVRTNKGVRSVPGDILPSTYWIAGTVEAERLLNTQNGRVEEITVDAAGTERVETAEGAVEAQRYVIHGALDTHVWYQQAGRWVGLAFDARGERVTYRLVERSGYLPTRPPQPEQS